MKISLVHIWNINQILMKADSDRGKGRHFINSNVTACAEHVKRGYDWLQSYAKEYGFGYVPGGRYDMSGNAPAMEAFEKFLTEIECDFNPNQMSPDIAHDIDGITLYEESLLAPLFVGFSVSDQGEGEEAHA